MTPMQIAFVLCLLATVQICVFASTCNVPSRFWCDSEEIASVCGVSEQCKNLERSVQDDAELVNFTLYYESLCPYSRNFITTMLYPTFPKISSIINLSLVPYGNAHETQVGNQWQFQCQHGPQECVGNLISTCAIAIVQNVAEYLPFLDCIAVSNLTPNQSASSCASLYNIPLDPILSCTQTDYGNQLQHQMALQTDALIPPHQYVPWVTLNGVHTEQIQNEAQSNLLKLICDTYTGQKPSTCN